MGIIRKPLYDAVRKIEISTQREALTFEEFLPFLKQYEPTNIYCEEWSSRKPFYEILNYGETEVQYTCGAFAKTQIFTETYEDFYKSIKRGGMGYYYAEVDSEEDQVKMSEGQRLAEDIRLLVESRGFKLLSYSSNFSDEHIIIRGLEAEKK